jgi:hypothetical protein
MIDLTCYIAQLKNCKDLWTHSRRKQTELLTENCRIVQLTQSWNDIELLYDKLNVKVFHSTTTELLLEKSLVSYCRADEMENTREISHDGPKLGAIIAFELVQRLPFAFSLIVK